MVNLPVLWTLELIVGQMYWDLLAMSLLVSSAHKLHLFSFKFGLSFFFNLKKSRPYLSELIVRRFRLVV
jgi:hypothetical protein